MFLTKHGLLTLQEIEWCSPSIERHFRLACPQPDGNNNVLITDSFADVPDLGQFVATALHRRLNATDWAAVSGFRSLPPHCIRTRYCFLLGDGTCPTFATFLPDRSPGTGQLIAKCRYYFEVKGLYERCVVINERLESGEPRATGRVRVDRNMAILLAPRLSLDSEPLSSGRHGFVDLLLCASSSEC